MGNKQKSRAKLAEAKRHELNRLYWYHGYYAGQVDQINGKGDQQNTVVGAKRFGGSK